MGIGKIFGKLGLAVKEEETTTSTAKAVSDSPLFREFNTVYTSCSEEESHFRCVSRLVANQHFDESIRAYEMLIEKFPEKRSLCEVYTGMVYLLMEEYRTAFDSFMAAKVHGADERESERRIWDACTGIMSKDVSNRIKNECIDLYVRLFPNGRHKEEAKSLLAVV